MNDDAHRPADLLPTGWDALATGAWQDAYDAFATAVERDDTAEALEDSALRPGG